jgi:hypothetical protein
MLSSIFLDGSRSKRVSALAARNVSVVTYPAGNLGFPGSTVGSFQAMTRSGRPSSLAFDSDDALEEPRRRAIQAIVESGVRGRFERYDVGPCLGLFLARPCRVGCEELAQRGS